MKKVVIDTNILYSWNKISENKELTSEKIEKASKKYDFYITSVSLAEIIVKYSNDLENIKKCLNFLFENKLKLIRIERFPIENEILSKIYNANFITEVKNDIDKIRDLKIYQEANLLVLLFIMIIYGIFHGIREEYNYKFEDKSKDNDFLLLSKIAIEANFKRISDTFISELKKGYAENNTDKVIRKLFSEEILSNFNLWIYYYYLVKHDCLKDLNNPNKEKLNQMGIDMLNDPFQKKIIKYLENPFGLISSKKYHVSIKEHINEMKKALTDINQFSEEFIEYALIKIEKSFKESSKIAKNDSLDLLILNCYYLKDFKFITIEKSFRKALKKIDPESYDIYQDIISK